MQDASGTGAPDSGAKLSDVNSGEAHAVGAVLTAREVWALGQWLATCAKLFEADGPPTEMQRHVMSALRKLLDKPTGLQCCYTERARIVQLLNEQLLDETPTNIDPNPAAKIRDAGYRGGWNDRARSLAKELQS